MRIVKACSTDAKIYGGSEEKLGAISPETDQQVRNAMTRAQAADEAGDNVACKEALAKVQRVIGP